MQDNFNLVTVTEARDRLGLTANRIRQFIREGRLTADKRGRMYWLDPIEISRFKLLLRKAGYPEGRPRRRTEEEHEKDAV